MSESISKIVDLAGQLIDQQGLAKHMYFTADGQYCTLGALRCVMYRDGWNGWDVVSAVYAIATELDPDWKTSKKYHLIGPSLKPRRVIQDWNDKEDTTKEDVVNTLRRVAQTLRNQEESIEIHA